MADSDQAGPADLDGAGLSCGERASAVSNGAPPAGRVPAFSLRAIEGGRQGSAGSGEAGELRLLVLDPRALTRDCLVAALIGTTRMRRVVAVGSIEEALHHIAGDACFDAALVNLAADPVNVAALAAIAGPLRKAAPDLPVMLLANLVDPARAAAALRQGVRGLLSSETRLDLLVEAIRFICIGWTIYPAFPLSSASDKAAPGRDGHVLEEQLTLRQLQVLQELERGLSNKAIALSLNVSERTVKAHVREVMRRLGASNRTQVVAFMAQRGTVLADDGGRI